VPVPVIRIQQLAGAQLAGNRLEPRSAAVTAELSLGVQLHQLVALQYSSTNLLIFVYNGLAQGRINLRNLDCWQIRRERQHLLFWRL
jgi:hypothetical protein